MFKLYLIRDIAMYTVINLSYEKIYRTDIRHLKSDNKHVEEQSKQKDGLRSSAANPYRRKGIQCSGPKDTVSSRTRNKERVCENAKKLKRSSATQIINIPSSILFPWSGSKECVALL